MSGILEGRVAVVTGAGGGIGRAIEIEMARDVPKVIVNDIGTSLSGEGASPGPARAVADEIRQAGGSAAPNTESVTDPDGAARLIQQAVDEFGTIDIVVNNAGILRDRIFHRM